MTPISFLCGSIMSQVSRTIFIWSSVKGITVFSMEANGYSMTDFSIPCELVQPILRWSQTLYAKSVRVSCDKKIANNFAFNYIISDSASWLQSDILRGVNDPLYVKKTRSKRLYIHLHNNLSRLKIYIKYMFKWQFNMLLEILITRNRQTQANIKHNSTLLIFAFPEILKKSNRKPMLCF